MMACLDEIVLRCGCSSGVFLDTRLLGNTGKKPKGSKSQAPRSVVALFLYLLMLVGAVCGRAEERVVFAP
jgi:hypothetical protein